MGRVLVDYLPQHVNPPRKNQTVSTYDSEGALTLDLLAVPSL